MLIESTYVSRKEIANKSLPEKYTDSRLDEIKRGISLKCAPFQLLLQDTREKSWAFNFVDAPGHPNFSDEVSAALRLADNVLLVVDVVEGIGA